MGMLARWKLGALALDLMQRAAELARTVDFDAAFLVLMKVVEIERERRGIPGAVKLTELLDWFTANYPAAGQITTVIAYVRSIVQLLNAAGVFRK